VGIIHLDGRRSTRPFTVGVTFRQSTTSILLDLALVLSTPSKSAFGFSLLCAGGLCLLWRVLSCSRRAWRKVINLFDTAGSVVVSRPRSGQTRTPNSLEVKRKRSHSIAGSGKLWRRACGWLHTRVIYWTRQPLRIYDEHSYSNYLL